MMSNIYRYPEAEPFRRRWRVWQTDGRTDGRTNKTAVNNKAL